MTMMLEAMRRAQSEKRFKMLAAAAPGLLVMTHQQELSTVQLLVAYDTALSLTTHADSMLHTYTHAGAVSLSSSYVALSNFTCSILREET